MKIEILGTGCAKCQQLEELVRGLVAEAGIEAHISKVQDISKILSYGVLTTPGLVVNGEVKVAGKIPSAEQIKGWLKI
jgi:small redox-active disulfide protein 2